MRTIQYRRQKKLLLIFIIILFSSCYSLFAQNVCISASGVAPQASAMLEVLSSSKGLLVPRVTLTGTTDITTVSSPADWLIVFNTATVSDVTPGIYYRDNTLVRWVRMGKLYTANNGLTLNSDNFQLGGSLIQHTTITQGAFNMIYNLDGTGNFDVQDAGTSKLYVKNNGMVGINTNNPALQLTLAGANAVFGVDNTAIFQAKNSAGTYENYLTPRGSDNITYLNYGSSGFNIRNNSSTSTIFMTNGNYVGIGTTTPGSLFSVGASSQLQVDANGDLVKIKNLTYSWPTSYAAGTGTVLRNDGSGNLTWTQIGGGTKICDVVLTNATSYNLTGLDGDNDIGYRIILMGNHPNTDATMKYCWIQPNGDNVVGDYSYSLDAYWGITGGGATGWTYSGYTQAGIVLYATYSSDNPTYVESEAIFNSFTGSRRHLIGEYSLGRSNTTGLTVNCIAGLWTNTATNITSLKFNFTGNSGFTGRLIVYKFQQ